MRQIPIFLSAVIRADSLMTGFGAACASAFRQWRLLLCVTGAAHAASGAVTAAGAGTLALFPVADLKENNGTDQQDHNGPRDQSWYVHTACSLYYRVVVISVPLQGHVLHCRGCCGLVFCSYRMTVHERLQPQPFTGLLIS